MKKVAVIVDPIEKLNSATDTSLELARSFFKFKAQVWLIEWPSIDWSIDQVFAGAYLIKDFSSEGAPILDSKPILKKIKDFQIVLIRKDPPFDSSYQKLCWMLQPFEKNIQFFNRPSILLKHHEKMIPLEALANGDLSKAEVIPTWIPPENATTKDSPLKAEDLVVKPYLGYQGHDVKRFSKNDGGISLKDMIVQPFLPEIEIKGDRRGFFFRGRYLGSILRVPKKGSILSNLAAGGTAKLGELTAKEKSLIKKLEKYFKKTGIEFAGTDMIAGMLNEVNITSPTALVAHRKVSGISLADQIAREMLKKPRWPK